MAHKTTSKTSSTQSPEQPSKTADDSREARSSAGPNFLEWGDFKNLFDTHSEPIKIRLTLLTIGLGALLYWIIGILLFLAKRYPNDSLAFVQTLIWPLTLGR